MLGDGLMRNSLLLLVLLAMLVHEGVASSTCAIIACSSGAQRISGAASCAILADCRSAILPDIDVIVATNANVSTITFASSNIASLTITLGDSTPAGSRTAPPLTINVTAVVIKANQTTTSTMPCFLVLSQSMARRCDVLIDQLQVTWGLDVNLSASATMALVSLEAAELPSNVSVRNSAFLVLVSTAIATPILDGALSIRTPNGSYVSVTDTLLSCAGGTLREEYHLLVFGSLYSSMVKILRCSLSFATNTSDAVAAAGSNSRGLAVFTDIGNDTFVSLIGCVFLANSLASVAAYTSMINFAGGYQVNFTVVVLSCIFNFNVSQSVVDIAKNTRAHAFRVYHNSLNVSVTFNDSVIVGDTAPFAGATVGVAFNGKHKNLSIFISNVSADMRGVSGVWFVNYGDKLDGHVLLVRDVQLQCHSTFSTMVTLTNQCMLVYLGKFTVTSSTFVVQRVAYTAVVTTESMGILFASGAALVCSVFSISGEGSTMTNVTMDIQSVVLSTTIGGSQGMYAPVVFTFMSPNQTSLTSLNFTVRDCVISFAIVVLAGSGTILGVGYAAITASHFTVENTTFAGTVNSPKGSSVVTMGFDLFGVSCIAFDACSFLDNMSTATVRGSTISLVSTQDVGRMYVIGVSNGQGPGLVQVLQTQASIVAKSPNKILTIPITLGFIAVSDIRQVLVSGSNLSVSCAEGCQKIANVGFSGCTFSLPAMGDSLISIDNTTLVMNRGGTPAEITKAHISFFGGSNSGVSAIVLRQLVCTSTVLNSLIAWDALSVLRSDSTILIANVSADANGDPTDGAAPNAVVVIPPGSALGVTITIRAPIVMPKFVDGVINVADSSLTWPTGVVVVFEACHLSDAVVVGWHRPSLREDLFPLVPTALLLAIARPLSPVNGSNRTIRDQACSLLETHSLSETIAASRTASSSKSVLPPFRQLPVTKPPRQSAVSRTQVAAMATGVLVAATIPGSGFSMQRVMSQIALSGGALFDPTAAMSVFDSPTQMNIGSPVYGAMRGCVVGNILIWAGCITAALVLSAVLSKNNALDLRAQAIRLGLPGKLSLPFDLLFQPTASSSLTLFFYSQDDGDMLVGICGLAVCVSWGWIWLRGYRSLNAVAGRPEEPPSDLRSGDSRAVVAVVKAFAPVRWLKANMCRWFTKTMFDGPSFDAYIARFEDYGPRRQWFLACEISTGFALAGLTAYMQSPQDDTPQMQLTVGNIIISALVLVSCIAQAHNERMARFNYTSTAMITMTSVALAAGHLNDAAAAVALTQIYLSIIAAAADFLERISSIVVLAVRLQVSVGSLLVASARSLTGRLVLSSSALQEKNRADRVGEGQQRRRSTSVVLRELRERGLVHQALTRGEAASNLSILVRYVAAASGGERADNNAVGLMPR